VSGSVSCPECQTSMTFDSPLRGEIVTCGNCGVEREVTSVNPLMLAVAPTEQEDWSQ